MCVYSQIRFVAFFVIFFCKYYGSPIDLYWSLVSVSALERLLDNL